MANILEQLATLKEDIKDNDLKKAEIAGERKGILKTLKNEYSLTIDDIPAEKIKLNKKIDKLNARIETAVDELNEEYDLELEV